MKNIARPHTGRHFLQIPGPTNVPERVLRAIAMPTIDHRGPEFALLGQEIVAGMKRVFQTGDFATLWYQMATRLGLEIDFVPGDWRHGVDPALVEEKLAADKEHAVKAVCVVHNETSTGVATASAR